MLFRSQGYYVESKRGGGGHIKIRKVDMTKSSYLMHIIKNIDGGLTNQDVDILISDLLSYGIVSKKEAKLLKVATSDNILIIPNQYRDDLRANIFKNMLLNLVDN